MQLKEEIQTKLRTFLENSPLKGPLTQASDKIGVDKVILFEIGICVTLGAFVLVFGAATVVNLICFIYPAVESLKVLKRDDVKICSKWLRYWLVYYSIQTLEKTIPALLARVPFYFWAKLAGLVWCYHPSTEGAAVVYELWAPVRMETMNTIDTILKDFFPKSLKEAKTSSEAAKVTVDTASPEHTATGLLVHIDTLNVSIPDSAADDSGVNEGPPKKPIYVEIYLSEETSSSPIGLKYKTHSMSGSHLSFDYSLTMIPSSDVLSKAGTNLCFAIKEKCTFGDDNLIGVLQTQVNLSMFGGSSGSPSAENAESDIVSVSVGRKSIALRDALKNVSLDGWIELVSQRTS